MSKYDLSNGYKKESAIEYFNKLVEKKTMIELKELRMPHSIDSLRLYHLWLNCIAKETGRIKDELHYLYRAKYLQKDEDHILSILKPELWQKIKIAVEEFIYFPGMNEIIDVISYSTAIYIKDGMDSKEFSDYMDKIRNHARVNFNIILLTLKDKHFEEFYREYGFC